MERKIIPFPQARRAANEAFEELRLAAENEGAELTSVIPRAEATPGRAIY